MNEIDIDTCYICIRKMDGLMCDLPEKATAIDCIDKLCDRIRQLEKEKKEAEINGMKFERKVWVGFILGNERVKKYWDDFRGDEFSADDAATITQMMIDEIQRSDKLIKLLVDVLSQVISGANEEAKKQLAEIIKLKEMV